MLKTTESDFGRNSIVTGKSGLLRRRGTRSPSCTLTLLVLFALTAPLRGQDAEPPEAEDEPEAPLVVEPQKVYVDVRVEAQTVISQFNRSTRRDEDLGELNETLVEELNEFKKLPWHFVGGDTVTIDRSEDETDPEPPDDWKTPRLIIRLTASGHVWSMSLSVIDMTGEEDDLEEQLSADIRKPGTLENVPGLSDLPDYLAQKLRTLIIRKRDGDGKVVWTSEDVRFLLKDILPIGKGHVLHTGATEANGAVLLPWSDFRKLSASIFEMVAHLRGACGMVVLESHGNGRSVDVDDPMSNGSQRKVIRVTHRSLDDEAFTLDVNSLKQLRNETTVFLLEFKKSKRNLVGELTNR